MLEVLIKLSMLICLSSASNNTTTASNNATSETFPEQFEVSGDANQTLKELTQKYGFQYEEYTVTTDDGYILGLYRIPGSVNASLTAKGEVRPPVLLIHGMWLDMMSWVWNEEKIAPAYVLSRAGYDVWLGNSRGVRNSEKHVSLDPKSKEYFDFSWEEMGTHDLPAFIDKIKTKTGFKKINYIGYSQGNTQLMAGAALKPDYFNKNINSAIFLAPVAAFNNGSILRQLTGLLIPLFGFKDFLLENKIYNYLPKDYKKYPNICNADTPIFGGSVCDLDFAKFRAKGLNSTLDNISRADVMVSNYPCGAGYRNILHYLQLFNNLFTDYFLRYDYGSEKNYKLYGTSSPPAYNLTNINFPVALQSGKHDFVGHPNDVDWLETKLNPFFSSEYKLEHMSFMIAKNMSWFGIDTIAALNYQNDKCDLKTQNSTCKVCNQKCGNQQFANEIQKQGLTQEVLAAKKKFFEYFQFSLVSGQKQVNDSMKKCLQMCQLYQNKCCAYLKISKFSNQKSISQQNFICIDQQAADESYRLQFDEFSFMVSCNYSKVLQFAAAWGLLVGTIVNSI